MHVDQCSQWPEAVVIAPEDGLGNQIGAVGRPDPGSDANIHVWTVPSGHA